MSRSHLSVASLVVLLAVPFSWLACGGGESKPPETPADESSSASASAAPAGSEAPATEAPAASATEAAPAASAAPAPAPAPAAPAMSDTDCGKCADKACTKQAAACGKNNDCQASIDSFHSCGSDKGAAACVDATSMPSGAKPKKLAAAYQACVKKALTSKACKASCSK